MTKPLVVIVGPTASGKSAFAIKVAERLNGEIICADSRTVYKGMDIGTAKPSKRDQAKVKHYLLDVVGPNQKFTVADFKRLAAKAIRDIHKRGKLPIMVGGSGLYVDSVLFNYSFGKVADLTLRKQLSQKTAEELQEICRQKDIDLPENYLNKRYLVRAIEIGGLVQQQKRLRKNTIVVGLTIKKETLRKKIEQRAETMLKKGVLQETQDLSKKHGWEGEAMKSDIYRVLRQVVEGSKALEEAMPEIVQADMRLAKKQLTWFKRNQSIIWGRPSRLMVCIEQFLKPPAA